jgi:hypothetical protein
MGHCVFDECGADEDCASGHICGYVGKWFIRKCQLPDQI